MLNVNEFNYNGEQIGKQIKSSCGVDSQFVRVDRYDKLKFVNNDNDD